MSRVRRDSYSAKIVGGSTSRLPRNIRPNPSSRALFTLLVVERARITLIEWFPLHSVCACYPDVDAANAASYVLIITLLNRFLIYISIRTDHPHPRAHKNAWSRATYALCFLSLFLFFYIYIARKCEALWRTSWHIFLIHRRRIHESGNIVSEFARNSYAFAFTLLHCDTKSIRFFIQKNILDAYNFSPWWINHKNAVFYRERHFIFFGFYLKTEAIGVSAKISNSKSHHRSVAKYVELGIQSSFERNTDMWKRDKVLRVRRYQTDWSLIYPASSLHRWRMAAGYPGWSVVDGSAATTEKEESQRHVEEEGHGECDIRYIPPPPMCSQNCRTGWW